MAKRIGMKFGEAMGVGSQDWLWTEPEIAIGELNGPLGGNQLVEEANGVWCAGRAGDRKHHRTHHGHAIAPSRM